MEAGGMTRASLIEPAGIGLSCGAKRGMGTVAGAAQAGRCLSAVCFPFIFRTPPDDGQSAGSTGSGSKLYHCKTDFPLFCYHLHLSFRQI